MKNSILDIHTVLLLNLCFSVVAPAQPVLRRIDEYKLPDFVYPLGDLAFANDSSMILTANGGLYVLNPPGWQMAPDSLNLLLSYQLMPERQDALFTVYHRSIGKTGLYWRHQNDPETRVEMLAILPGGFYRLLQKDNAVFVFGNDGDSFHIYEYTTDTLIDLYTSKRYIPAEVRVLNRNTLLMAIGNRIVSLHRTAGLNELFILESPVLSFSIRNERQLFVITQKGVCVYDTGELKMLAAGITGKLFIEKNTLFLLNAENRKLYTFQF